VEIFGPEASGKTTLALHVIAEAQKLGGWLSLYAIFEVIVKMSIAFGCFKYTIAISLVLYDHDDHVVIILSFVWLPFVFIVVTFNDFVFIVMNF